MTKGSSLSLASLSLCLFLFCAQSRALVQEKNDELYDVLAKGYEALARSPAEAIPFFKEAAVLDFSNATIRKQLGSAYIAVNRYEDALSQFILADKISPSDSTKLQIAYLLNGLGRIEESSEAFEQLRASADPGIRRTAEKAVIILKPALGTDQYPWWGKLLVAPYYDTRFKNTVFFGVLSGGRYLDEAGTFSLFGTLSMTRDTRSAGGAIPAVFSDNYVLAAAGLRITPFTGFAAEILGGVAHDLDDRPDRKMARGDVRGVLTYGTGIFAPFSFPERMTISWKPWVEVYSSAGYYSRYENVLGYHQLRAGTRFLEAGAAGADLYLRGDFTWDTSREFYNNIAEGAFGIRLIPNYAWGVTILAEVHRGLYWDHSLSSSPWDRWYSSTRFALVLERPINF